MYVPAVNFLLLILIFLRYYNLSPLLWFNFHALTGNENFLGASSSSEVNVVENLRVRGDYDHVKYYRPNEEDEIKFCSKECTPSLPCWCCDRRGRASQCFPTENECNHYCA
ncbi:hypothetical protein RchiOBHm_Chr2g0103281 [Rosa chinensis]|uniref:Uncharacterized protein n=1 Tax=Rosa chinensis TaxID=74649 RepID=A0A2P6RMX9_ROSCH|nr:hypothetical protein RchiOBHm_Chr2g0103281 [Rosa chinensis]